ncbi:hypothetical protein EPI10_023703 [Gossypium australe]|uniref:Uncharacterized protein n=1 Tax=Gossypium australe TaxID=47621 RepID=A0A5B6VWK6_9ROSI|nr:hypothetical protein EPI10_023703 [Gossypium australe]
MEQWLARKVDWLEKCVLKFLSVIFMKQSVQWSKPLQFVPFSLLLSLNNGHCDKLIELTEEVYIQQPLGYVQTNENG